MFPTEPKYRIEIFEVQSWRVGTGGKPDGTGLDGREVTEVLDTQKIETGRYLITAITESFE